QVAVLKDLPNLPSKLVDSISPDQIHPDNVRPLMEQTAEKVLSEAGHDPKSPEFKNQKEALGRNWEMMNKGEISSEMGWIQEARDFREAMREGREIKIARADGELLSFKHAQGGERLKDTARWSDAQLTDLAQQIGLKLQPQGLIWIRELIHARGSENFNYQQVTSSLKILNEAFSKADKRGDFESLSAKEKDKLRVALFADVLKGELKGTEARKLGLDLSKGEIKLTLTGGEVNSQGKKTPLGYKVDPAKKAGGEKPLVAAAYAGELPVKKVLPQDAAPVSKPLVAEWRTNADGRAESRWGEGVLRVDAQKNLELEFPDAKQPVAVKVNGGSVQHMEAGDVL